MKEQQLCSTQFLAAAVADVAAATDYVVLVIEAKEE